MYINKVFCDMILCVFYYPIFLIVIYLYFFRYLVNKNIMADISVKEFPWDIKYKSLITSTPHKSIDDSGYNTPSSTIISNASSNFGQISEVSISFDHTSSSDLQLSSNTSHKFTLENISSKLEDITNKTNSDASYSQSSTCNELSPSKKFKLSPDMRLRYRINKCPKDDNSQFLKRKNFTPYQNINHKRTSLEGRENVDIMYFLAERHHFEPVTEKIFSFLSGSDIISMSMVSKVWCNAVQNSPMALKQKRMYFKLSKENRSRYDGRDRSIFNNKGYLANIGNVMRSPSKKDLPQRSPPVSPSKYRFHVFQKVRHFILSLKHLFISTLESILQ